MVKPTMVKLTMNKFNMATLTNEWFLMAKPIMQKKIFD